MKPETAPETNHESQWLEELAKGNHYAFNKLFLAYHHLVSSFLYGFIKYGDDALDIAQDIFYNIWLHREKMSEVVSFKAYLFRMARNAVYNYYKLNSIHEEHLEKFQKKISIEDNSPEEKIYAEELELLLDIVVDNMPPQRKLIFTMSRKEGLTNEEIAQKLDINKRTVENHITHALADLRKVLKVVLLFFPI